MKTDRELLELAARAAGIVGVWHERGQCIHVTDCEGMSDIWWRPHEDDGDALRLAAVIPACVVIDGDMKWCGVHLNGNRGKYDLVEPMSGDPCAATRRAIVRAAAAIGERMK